MRPGLGFDWSKLVQIGVQAAATITRQPASVVAGGRVITGTPPTQNSSTQMPAWFIPAAVGVGVVLLLGRSGRR